MKRIIVMAVAFLILFSGCAEEKSTELTPINKTVSCSKPYISVGGSCCLDLNENNVCDSRESASSTKPETTATTLPGEEPIIEEEDTETWMCQDTDRECMSECDRIIKDETVKPATRTVRLCLRDHESISYAGLNLSADKQGNDTFILSGGERTGIDNKTDAVIGNVVFRLIGSTRKNNTLYLQTYAWTVKNEIECSKDADCMRNANERYACYDNTIYVITEYGSCKNAGTVFAKCEFRQSETIYSVCHGSQRCIPGDDECFSNECFNNKKDGSEDGVDCGGGCRPCHCRNGAKDEGETGTDCGGECKPCEKKVFDDVAPRVSIQSPTDRTYGSNRIDLNYSVNEEAAWCGYSLNGLRNLTVSGNSSIYAPEGRNTIVLSCTDASGNSGSAQASFTIAPVNAQTCPQDIVSRTYRSYPGGVEFRTATESFLGIPSECDEAVYSYALDAGVDAYLDSRNETTLVSDAKTNKSKTATLSYGCADARSLSIGYVTVTQPGRQKGARLLLYFYEGTIDAESAYFRIHPYTGDGVVEEGRYVDYGYEPRESMCAEGLLYQEMDLSPVMDISPAGDTKLRMGVYSKSLRTELYIVEIELSS